MQEDFIKEADISVLVSRVSHSIPKIDSFISDESMFEISAKALQLARAFTQRTKLLILEDPKKLISLPHH